MPPPYLPGCHHHTAPEGVSHGGSDGSSSSRNWNKRNEKNCIGWLLLLQVSGPYDCMIGSMDAAVGILGVHKISSKQHVEESLSDKVIGWECGNTLFSDETGNLPVLSPFHSNLLYCSTLYFVKLPFLLLPMCLFIRYAVTMGPALLLDNSPHLIVHFAVRVHGQRLSTD